VEALVPYLDESWIVQEVVRYLGDAVLESPSQARAKIRDTAAALASHYGEGADLQAPRPHGGAA
jgi:predicted DNA-binding transcriptional regulator YafY